MESFFPATTGMLKVHAAHVYESVFPSDVVEQCPEVVTIIANIDLMTIRIRNPMLLLWAVVGAVFGLHRSVVLWNVSVANQQQKQDTMKLWAVAFWFFGLMNVVAIPLHSLLPVVVAADNVHPLLLPQQYPMLWILDCYFTGAFATAILCACRHERSISVDDDVRRIQNSSNGGANNMIVRTWLAWNLMGGVGAIVAFCFFGDNNNNISSFTITTTGTATLPLELWYTAPLVTAVVVFLPLLVRDVVFVAASTANDDDANAKQQRHWRPVALCVGAVALSVTGLLLDAPLCRWRHDTTTPDDNSNNNNNSVWPFLDSGRAPAVAFAACDLAFYGVYSRLLASQQLQQQEHDEKKKL